jgi:hypothetical protein
MITKDSSQASSARMNLWSANFVRSMKSLGSKARVSVREPFP